MTVVEMRFVAEVARDEVELTGLLADVAVSCDTIAWFHTGRIEELAQRLDVF